MTDITNYYQKYEHCIMGKYHKTRSRRDSTISVQEPGISEILNCRSVMLLEHPLLKVKPDEWKNIPIPLAEALKSIIASILKSCESVYDFQIKQNMRLHKL